jgi:hypothetical protein
MKIFSKLTNPHLESFILVHNTNITSKSQLPTKGNLKDAKDNTMRNRIRVAFECRMMMNKVNAMLWFDLSNKYKEEKEDYHEHLISLTNNKTVLPSTLLSVSLRVNYVIHFLHLDKTAAATSKDSESNKEKANLLLIKLCEQFKSHGKVRVKQVAKQRSLDLEVCIQELACSCCNNASLEPPQDRAQVSELNIMFAGLQFQPVYSLSGISKAEGSVPIF